MSVHHYRAEDGHVGQPGELLHCVDTDEWCLVGEDGRGHCLIGLAVVDRTGDTCVGDWRLSALDVGFDLRRGGMPVAVPDWHFASLGLDMDGRTYEVFAARRVLIAVATAAGYLVAKQGDAPAPAASE